MHNELEPEVLREIERTLDVVIDTFQKGSPTFQTDAEIARFYHAFVGDRRRNWRRPKTCLYPACEQPSVTASHSLARSGPLQIIAEAGHVATPLLDHKSGRLQMMSVGIGRASTFPGFCPEHESTFGELERLGDASSGRFVELQIYRTISRELALLENQIRSLDKARQSYERLRDEYSLELVRDALGTDFIRQNQINVSSVTSNLFDWRLEVINRGLTHAKSLCEELRRELFEPAALGITTGADTIAAIVLTFPMSLPVALSGRGNFAVRTKQDEIHDIPVILNVWPQRASTSVMIGARVKDEAAVHSYMADFNRSSDRLISMVETWMVHGSDHWFLAPWVWRRIPASRQQRIVDDIWDIQRNIGIEYEWSIFDDLREQVLTGMLTGNEPSDELFDYVERERRKAGAPPDNRRQQDDLRGDVWREVMGGEFGSWLAENWQPIRRSSHRRAR